MPDKPLAIGFNVPFNEAIDFTKKRGVVLPEKYYGQMQGIHRTLNYSIAGVASLDQLQAVLDSLEQALSVGKTFNDWKKDVRIQDLGLPKYRLDNIYRTNIQTAYNRGRWEQQVENKKSQPYLMYDAINDSRVRPSHLAMDGIIRPVGDSFWNSNYPPNGYRCRCRCIALSQSQAEARSKNGKGLNQKITDEMKSDKGWDYNVGEDLTAGINQAVEQRNSNERIARQLKVALNEKLAKAEQMLKSEAEKEITKTTMIDKKAFADFVEKVTAENYKARHEFVRVGTLPDFVMADAAVIALEPINNEIHVSDYQLKHAQRNKKSAPLPLEIVKQLPEKLENSRWFYDSILNNLTAVFDVGTEKIVGKAIVVINFDRNKKTCNAVKTSGEIDISTLKMRNYREIKVEP